MNFGAQVTALQITGSWRIFSCNSRGVEFLIGSGAVLGTALPQAALLADAARLREQDGLGVGVGSGRDGHSSRRFARQRIARLPFPVRSQSVT